MIKYKTVIKCPICKYKKEIDMSENLRQLLYDCKECSARLKPKDNDCCVICSHGSVPCPTAQKQFVGDHLKKSA